MLQGTHLSPRRPSAPCAFRRDTPATGATCSCSRSRAVFPSIHARAGPPPRPADRVRQRQRSNASDTGFHPPSSTGLCQLAAAALIAGDDGMPASPRSASKSGFSPSPPSKHHACSPISHPCSPPVHRISHCLHLGDVRRECCLVFLRSGEGGRQRSALLPAAGSCNTRFGAEPTWTPDYHTTFLRGNKVTSALETRYSVVTGNVSERVCFADYAPLRPQRGSHGLRGTLAPGVQRQAPV